MRARVSSTSPLPVVQSAGIRFDCIHWVLVPSEAEAEIANNPLQEIEPEMQVTAEKTTLIVNKRAKGAKVRNI